MKSSKNLANEFLKLSTADQIELLNSFPEKFDLESLEKIKNSNFIEIKEAAIRITLQRQSELSKTEEKKRKIDFIKRHF